MITVAVLAANCACKWTRNVGDAAWTLKQARAECPGDHPFPEDESCPQSLP